MDWIDIRRYRSPYGEMMVGGCGDRLCICDWTACVRCAATVRRLGRLLGAECREQRSAIVERAIEQLEEYFAGERREFTIDVALTGSAFQSRVWNELMSIPYGAVVSYGGLARRIGRPEAVRAVAGAVGSNPLSIFVPCHRVTGSNNRLTGYRGGLAAKEGLLVLEARVCGGCGGVMLFGD